MKFGILLAVACSAVCAFEAGAADFTLKSSVSGTDFDWSLGANYVGEPASGPRSGDKIIIPSGVTAIVNEAAAAKTGTCGICDIEVQSGGTMVAFDNSDKREITYVRTITGAGTVTSAGAKADDLSIGSSCVFDGIFAGVLNLRFRTGVRFEVTRADHPGTGAPINENNSTYVINRYLPASGSGCAPGYNSFNFNLGSVVEYIGAE